MRRFILTLGVLTLFAGAADAGPIRDRLAGGCLCSSANAVTARGSMSAVGIMRNVAARWRDRFTRAGRVMVAVAERVTPTVAVQIESGKPAMLFSYRLAPSTCANGRCND